MNGQIVISIVNGVVRLEPSAIPPHLIMLFLELTRDEVKANAFKSVDPRGIEQPTPEQASALLTPPRGNHHASAGR